jgi:hypothetical protein
MYKFGKVKKNSYKDKIIIVKNLLISYCGFEIEMKGIPDKFKKEIETLIWDFIWDGKVNQIIRDVCCLDIEKGGMSMVIIDSYIDSRRIKFLKHEFLLNTSKWSIWKARNKVKNDKIHINQTLLYNIWKQTLKSELNILLKANCNDTIDKTKILTIISLISI